MFFSNGKASTSSSANDVQRSATRVAGRERPNETAPLVIEYFHAYPATATIRLVWGVFSEKDVAGFRIYRMSRSDASYVVVSGNGLIPAWHQEYSDREVTPSTLYRYVLGVVFSDGSEVISQAVEAYPK